MVKCAHLNESQLQNTYTHMYTCVCRCVQHRLQGFSKEKLFRKMTFKNPAHLLLFLYINQLIFSKAKT